MLFVFPTCSPSWGLWSWDKDIYFILLSFLLQFSVTCEKLSQMRQFFCIILNLVYILDGHILPCSISFVLHHVEKSESNSGKFECLLICDGSNNFQKLLQMIRREILNFIVFLSRIIFHCNIGNHFWKREFAYLDTKCGHEPVLDPYWSPIIINHKTGHYAAFRWGLCRWTWCTYAGILQKFLQLSTT